MFVVGVKIKATVESKLNDSPEASHFLISLKQLFSRCCLWLLVFFVTVDKTKEIGIYFY